MFSSVQSFDRLGRRGGYEERFSAAKRLFANIVHKVKRLFFGNEIARATSSWPLFNICDRLICRKSSPLPSAYPLLDQPNVFNGYFLQKVQSILVDLDQQSLSPVNCRLTYQHCDSSFHSFHPITEAGLKATILSQNLLLVHWIPYHHH